MPDDLITTCSLKQDFRDKFWLPYIEKLTKKPIKYLTLYCPPAMDVRHFCEKGFIEFKNDVYQGVVGVTWDRKGYVHTIENLEGRLEQFKIGKIYNFLRENDKRFIEKFPFDVINLDYCNHLVNNYVSDNLEDIEGITSTQKDKGCDRFVLFITSRTDRNAPRGGFLQPFMKELKHRIKLNIDKVPEFKGKYDILFSQKDPTYNEFVSIGIVKFVSNMLAEKGYSIEECSAAWLIRNNISPQRDLLHLAFLISLKKPQKKRRKTYREYGGRGRLCLEGSAARILDELIAGKVYVLTERGDGERLDGLYGDYIAKLKESNFELSIPNPLEEA